MRASDRCFRRRAVAQKMMTSRSPLYVHCALDLHTKSGTQSCLGPNQSPCREQGGRVPRSELRRFLTVSCVSDKINKHTFEELQARRCRIHLRVDERGGVSHSMIEWYLHISSQKELTRFVHCMHVEQGHMIVHPSQITHFNAENFEG